MSGDDRGGPDPRRGAPDPPATAPHFGPIPGRMPEGRVPAADPGLDTDDGGTSVQPDVPPGSSSGFTPPGVGVSRSSGEVALPGRLEPGLLILNDRYEVVRQLGKGGMGEVWLVHQRVLDVAHALKLITPAIAFDHQVRQRFRQEARVMARFQHPNAVVVHDAQIGEGAAYILMEYVPGRSLYDELKARPGPRGLERTGRLLKQLCSVLHRAHAKGIVHRDLKPSNLMLAEGEPPDSDLKVLDFGIAKVLDVPEEHALTRTDHFLGTPFYASPEQHLGSKVDGRSDLYSVGVILYELLAGRRPFDGSGHQQMLAHATLPAPRFEARAPGVAVPEAVEAVVLSCLAKAPGDRPQTARDLYAAFVRALPPEFQPSSVSTWGFGSGSGGSSLAAQPAESWESSAPETSQRTAAGETPVPSDLGSSGLGPAASSGSVERFHPSVETPMGPLLTPSGASTEPSTRAGAGSGRPPTPSPASSRSSGVVAPMPEGPPSAAGPVPGAVEAEGPAPDARGRGPSSVALVAAALALMGVGGGLAYLVRSGGLAEAEAEGPPPPVEASEAPPAVSLPDGYAAAPGAEGPSGEPPRVLVRGEDGVEFVFLPGTGESPFEMGNDSSFEEPFPGDEDVPTVPVLLSPFYLQRHEVTIGEVERVLTPEEIASESMAAFRRARDDIIGAFGEANAGRFPAAGVPISEAARFANRVGGTLPTEAQWEYAARSAGQRRRFVWKDQDQLPSPEIAQIGHGAFEDRTNVARPGSFLDDQTDHGVFDLTGNLREWCRDPFAPYRKRNSPAVDPGRDLPPVSSQAPGEDGFVIRGSSFLGHVDEFRTTRPRHFRRQEEKVDIFTQGALDIGFRVVLELPEPARADLAE